MRHEINLGRHIDEVRQSQGAHNTTPTTYVMVDDIWVNAVIKDLESALHDLQRIKR